MTPNHWDGAEVIGLWRTTAVISTLLLSLSAACDSDTDGRHRVDDSTPSAADCNDQPFEVDGIGIYWQTLRPGNSMTEIWRGSDYVFTVAGSDESAGSVRIRITSDEGTVTETVTIDSAFSAAGYSWTVRQVGFEPTCVTISHSVVPQT